MANMRTELLPPQNPHIVLKGQRQLSTNNVVERWQTCCSRAGQSDETWQVQHYNVHHALPTLRKREHNKSEQMPQMS